MKNITKENENVIRFAEEIFKNCKCVLFEGTPDARYKKGYFLYAASVDGFAAPGTYGNMLAHSTSLEGLVGEIKKYQIP